MNYGIFDILSLLGALGFFIYGMKIMSDGVQKVAGTKLRQILASMTSNRFFGVTTGFLITCIIQSSSATTVMVVSFVNAGLLSLVESIGVIMGANIGTTITAWLISIFGFKVQISDFSLIIIGVSFPLLFAKNNNLKNLAETLIGFAFLFMGLEALKNNVPDLQNNPEVLEFLKDFSYENKSYFGKTLTTLLFVVIGTIVTITVQSSSAAMALTLVMTNQGWIPFPLAAAMVLGENIGTTITANLAALVANTNAKRAARAHLIFNLFGVVWMILAMPIFISGIDKYMFDNDFGSPMQIASSVPIGLSIFHTVFNILNVFILIWFTRSIATVVTKLVKDKRVIKDDNLPIYLNQENIDNVDKAMKEVKQELGAFSSDVVQAMKNLREYITNMSNISGEVKDLRKSISEYAKRTNAFNRIISDYLIELSQKEVPKERAQKIARFLEISNDLENLTDLVESMASEIEKNRSKALKLTNKQKAHLDDLLKHMINSLLEVKELIDNDFNEGELQKIREDQYLDNILKRIRNEHIEDKLNKDINLDLSLYYTKLQNLSEQIYYRIRSLNSLTKNEKIVT